MCIHVAMHIEVVPNRGSKPAVLLRESYRDGKKLPMDQVAAIRRILKGEQLVAVDEAFEVVGSRLHGHVDAVLRAIKRLGLERLLASRPCRERNLIVAMVVARIIEPGSKLATTRSWHTTTLPHLLEVTDADEDDLYDAMDWRSHAL